MTQYNPDNVPKEKVVHIDTLTGKSLTYGGLRNQASRAAWGLTSRLGLSEGERVLVLVPNSTDFITLVHTVWWYGGIFRLLNASSTAKDIARAVSLVKPACIAFHPSRTNAVHEALQEVGALSRSKEIKLITLIRRGAGLPLFPDEFISRSSSQALPPYDLTGKSSKATPAAICFSSGTTGNFKAVQLSHRNIIASIIQTRIAVPGLRNSSSREVFFAPYCHIYGLSAVVANGMWLGNFTCGMPNLDLELFCSKMAEYRATWAHLVPPVAVSLVASDVCKRYDLSSIEHILIAAAPTKKGLQMRLKARFGVHTKILQGYGLTECGPTVMLQHDADEEYIGSVGKVISGTEVRLVDPETDLDVERGQEGELWVRGPQVMMGYLGDEVATNNTFSGDWLKTGDIMRIDENNNFWITDRLKELIKYKGFQVAPSELEDLLLRHPHVVDAAVCSIYDDQNATELPVAYVSLDPDHKDLAESRKRQILDDIRTWADGQVAGYKKLRGGVFQLQNVPKTASGKIMRTQLPARVQQRLQNKM
ncbi:amp dependent CoA ligase [Exophiala viscosa]|uniref:Amp dependent CoA ligase n=1 Tax=Exophiala viscosa TaxID=2486360 RepID=A0AAN6I928_9EURO|nr:amp dependent CoA ligase [Exophiala viscosa]